jgi:autotransporter passenger strand-loop-strand repeat protein
MTVFRSPPTQSDLVLNSGDSLYVRDGDAFHTTINAGGLERDEGSHSLSNGTTINTGGVEIVLGRGHSDGTTINTGGVERLIDTGYSENTTINAGGLESVEREGFAVGTVIHTRGVESVEYGGLAINVIFSGPGATLKLDEPSELKGLGFKPGTISGWQVGDVIDFLNTTVTSVHGAGNTLTVTYAGKQTTYMLSGQQANTEFKLQSDGHGGTDLILVPIIGVQHHDAPFMHHDAPFT